MKRKLRACSRPQGRLGADGLRGQLRNIAPFVTLLFLVAFFGAVEPARS